MRDPKVRCSICKECKKEKCEWFGEPYPEYGLTAICLFEPCDTGDIGSATVEEMRKQNDDY